LEAGLSFPWDTFDIKTMIENKMIYSGFLGCNIDVDLPFWKQNFNFRVGSFFYLVKKKKNNKDIIMPLRRNMHVFRSFTVFFFYWNSSNIKLPLGFTVTRLHVRVFMSFSYKLLFIFGNDCQTLRSGIAIRPKGKRRGPFNLIFN
jgi:hypothetical protein